jgi:hypothetical protein
MPETFTAINTSNPFTYLLVIIATTNSGTILIEKVDFHFHYCCHCWLRLETLDHDEQGPEQ